MTRRREDEDSFIYNSEIIDAERYAQHQTRTPVSTRQIPSCLVRDASLEGSIIEWNKVYQDRASSSDDVTGRFSGVISAYGNGYDYLEETDSDDFQSYSKIKNIMTLEDTQQKSDEKIPYSTITDAKIVENLNKAPEKGRWFRTLLYQNQWQYPKHYTDDSTQIRKVDLYDIVPASDFAFERTEMSVPHNIMYSIYPRCAYDTDNDMAIVFMLRSPSVVEENNYKMRYEDLRIMVDNYEPLDNKGLNPVD